MVLPQLLYEILIILVCLVLFIDVIFPLIAGIIGGTILLVRLIILFPFRLYKYFITK